MKTSVEQNKTRINVTHTHIYTQLLAHQTARAVRWEMRFIPRTRSPVAKRGALNERVVNGAGPPKETQAPLYMTNPIRMMSENIDQIS